MLGFERDGIMHLFGGERLNSVHKFISCAVMSVLLSVGPVACSKTILYVPQDNRPVDYAYTVSTATDAGYTVITPPEKYLSGANFQGSPEDLLNWVNTHAGEADAMVLSIDSLVYGGLVDSRKHNLSMAVLESRLKAVEAIHERYGSVPIYAFSTVMRSPWAGGKGVEPDYYLKFGSDIYELAGLQNKLDEEGLNPEERSNWFAIMRRVPLEYLQDWFNRRNKNMAINHRLIEDAKKGVFAYYSLGHDDNSAHTQSSLEAKYLEMAGKEVPKKVFGSFPGADQLGLLLITRANNDFNQYHPKVAVIYPLGGAEKTVPSYDGQAIGKTIAAHIEAVGGTLTTTGRPDLLLAVNTPLTTSTGESASFENFPIMLESTKAFLQQIESAVADNIPVSLVDMAFSNGSDNTLVYGLYKDKMLYRLAGYNGWNTASNSVGYGLSQGILARYMTPERHAQMLTTQYLDNWAYQANVRDYTTRMKQKIEGNQIRRYYPTVMGELQSLTQMQVQRYAEDYLGVDPRTIQVTFPWNRLFEVYVDVHDQPDVVLEAQQRQRMRQRELNRLQENYNNAVKAIEAAKKQAAEAQLKQGQAGTAPVKINPQLEQARQAALAKYEEEKQAQAVLDAEEAAQHSRTWQTN